MGTKKVYEFAKEHNVSSKELMQKAKEVGINFQSHMSIMGDEDINKMNKAMNNNNGAQGNKTTKPAQGQGTPKPKQTNRPTTSQAPTKKTTG